MIYELKFNIKNSQGELVTSFSKESGDLNWVIANFILDFINWYKVND